MTDWNKIEEDAEKIWDLWREGLITHKEVQERLDNDVLPWTPHGFFKNIETEISKLVTVRIPMQAKYKLTDLAYFNKRRKLQEEIVKTTDWTSFWVACDWLDYPTEQDKKDVHNLDAEDLTEFHIIIFKSLIDLAKQNQQDSEACKKLHQYYKLTRAEMEARSIFKEHGDAFLEFLGDKQQHVSEEERMEEARISGDFCPYCDSTNVGSYNREQFYCRDCKKRWRKR